MHLNYCEPDPFGEISFTVYTAPVSSQSERVNKKIYMDSIKQILKPFQYILTGDVKINIDWFVNEDERYETDRTADVDNIIKPTVDAMSGPEGILINDCQVRSISCCWKDRYDQKEHVAIQIKYFPDETINKKGLIFVHLGQALCMPLLETLEPHAIKILLKAFERQLSTRNKLIQSGANYYDAKSVMSVQRFFHKSRLEGFIVRNIENLKQGKLI